MRRILIAITVVSLVLAPAAVAATKRFAGKNEQNRPLSFKVRNGKVVDFVGGINLFCIGEGIQFDAAIPPRSMKVTNGKFRYKGDDKEGHGSIEIKGTITGTKASGRMSMVTTRYSSSQGRVISCSGNTKWSAKQK